jgi:hypothetical protein
MPNASTASACPIVEFMCAVRLGRLRENERAKTELTLVATRALWSRTTPKSSSQQKRLRPF